MATYLSVYTVLGLIGLSLPNRHAAAPLVLVGTFLVLFMGYRYHVGCDYTGYLNRWTNADSGASWSELLRRPEPGFELLQTAVQRLGLGYNAFLAICSTILVACYVRFARAHPASLMIMAYLFPIIVVQLGMSGLRQAIAGGLLMTASVAFVQGRSGRTALLILLGAQFHTSVLVFLPMALLAGRDVSPRRLVAAVLAVGPVAALLLAGRAETYAERYVGTDVSSGGASIRYALVMLPVVFAFMTRTHIRRAYPQVFPFLQLAMIMCASLAPLVALSSIALHRLNYYVLPFSILCLIYAVLASLPHAQRAKGLAVGWALYAGYSVFWFAMSRHAAACYVPYSNTLLGPT